MTSQFIWRLSVHYSCRIVIIDEQNICCFLWVTVCIRPLQCMMNFVVFPIIYLQFIAVISSALRWTSQATVRLIVIQPFFIILNEREHPCTLRLYTTASSWRHAWCCVTMISAKRRNNSSLRAHTHFTVIFSRLLLPWDVSVITTVPYLTQSETKILWSVECILIN